MNNAELTKWLLKVRDALAEPDEVKRNSMLRAADRFLKGNDQQSLAFRRTRIGERGRGRGPGQIRPAEARDRTTGNGLTEPKKRLLGGGAVRRAPYDFNRV
jgi:hypothetical protein